MTRDSWQLPPCPLGILDPRAASLRGTINEDIPIPYLPHFPVGEHPKILIGILCPLFACSQDDLLDLMILEVLDHRLGGTSPRMVTLRSFTGIP